MLGWGLGVGVGVLYGTLSLKEAAVRLDSAHEACGIAPEWLEGMGASDG